MADYGIILDGLPALKVTCQEDLVKLWSRHNGRRKVWQPTEDLALNTNAVIGVKKLEPVRRKRRIKSKPVIGF